MKWKINYIDDKKTNTKMYEIFLWKVISYPVFWFG